MDEVSKKKIVSVNLVVLCFLFWITWSLIMGPIGCPKTLVKNYHSTLRNISEELRSHMIWWYRPWFGSAWSGSKWSGLGWCSLVLCTRI